MPNLSVDSDTLRQGSARRRWTSCTSRPLAATCRSPSRYTDTGRLDLQSLLSVRGVRPSQSLGRAEVSAASKAEAVNRRCFEARSVTGVAGNTAPQTAQKPGRWFRRRRLEAVGTAVLHATAVGLARSASILGIAVSRVSQWARYNRSVDSDTLRHAAARRRWKSCTVRPHAATCRSPSRYAAGAEASAPSV